MVMNDQLYLRVRETVVVGVEKWSSSLSAAVDVDLYIMY